MKTAILPCRHILCSTCLERRAEDEGPHSCPLDRTPLQPDIPWMVGCEDQLAALQVTCWNSEHGCGFVGPLGKLLEHFEQLCSFHTSPCLRCRDTIPRKDLPGHYTAGCTAIPSPLAEVREAAAAQTSSEQQLQPAVAACLDMLVSIQSWVNELTEKALGSSLGGCREAARENEGTEACSHEADSEQQGAGPLAVSLVRGGTERGAISVSLRETMSTMIEACIKLRQLESAVLGTHSISDRFLQGVQGTSTPLTESDTATERAASGGSGDCNASSATELIVWTLTFDTDCVRREVYAYNLAFININNGRFHVHMKCVCYKDACTAGVYVEVTNSESGKPVKCELLSVESLSSQEALSPSCWVRGTLSQPYVPGEPRMPLRYVCPFGNLKQDVSEQRYMRGFLIKVKLPASGN